MYGNSGQTFDNRFHKLGVDMVVGDFNGDQIDGIAVLSYFFERCDIFEAAKPDPTPSP